MFSFDGQTKDYIHSIQDIQTHYGPNRQIDRDNINGRRGAVLRRVQDNEKTITLNITVMPQDNETFQNIADDMVEWLYSDEPKRLELPDNPDRFYYAMLEGGIERDEIIYFAQCTLTFVSMDGLQYSAATYNNTAISDVVDVVNEGTAPTDITVEARALEDSTSFMITKGDSDYFMVGEVEDTEQETKDLTPFKYNDEFNQESFLGWQYPMSDTHYGDELDGGDAAGGKFEFLPNSIMVSEWGRNPNTGWHGASVQKSIGESLQDFNIMFKIGVRQSNADGPGKSFTYLYDEDNNIQFSIGYANTAVGGNMGAVVVNAYNEYGESTRLYTRHTRNQDKRLDDMSVFMEVERRGNKITITSYKYDEHGDPSRRNPLDKNTETYTDAGEHYQRLVRLSHIYSGKNARYSNFQRHFILGIYIQELLTDDNAIPILIKSGDLIYIDTERSYVSINEEPKTDIKDFGSNYFKVNKGLTTLLIEPQGVFDTTVRWHDRYL